MKKIKLSGVTYLIRSGQIKPLSDRAISFAESNLGLPKPGQDRDAMLGTLGKWEEMKLDQGLVDQIRIQLNQ